MLSKIQNFINFEYSAIYRMQCILVSLFAGVKDFDQNQGFEESFDQRAII